MVSNKYRYHHDPEYRERMLSKSKERSRRVRELNQYLHTADPDIVLGLVREKWEL